MDTQKAFLVIGITLVVVILFNLAIYALISRRKDSVGEVELFRKAMKQARNPWREEQENLEALADKVSRLESASENKESKNES